VNINISYLLSYHRFCQGLNTAQLNYNDFGIKKDEIPNRYAPFLSGKVGSKGWSFYFASLGSHMRCERLVSSLRHRGEVNHYVESTTGFHVTFFEIMPSYMSRHPKFKERGRWKQGPLYNQWGEDRLCESAFTVRVVVAERRIMKPLTNIS
jgi:hypothetical protein